MHICTYSHTHTQQQQQLLLLCSSSSSSARASAASRARCSSPPPALARHAGCQPRLPPLSVASPDAAACGVGSRGLRQPARQQYAAGSSTAGFAAAGAWASCAPSRDAACARRQEVPRRQKVRRARGWRQTPTRENGREARALRARGWRAHEAGCIRRSQRGTSVGWELDLEERRRTAEKYTTRAAELACSRAELLWHASSVGAALELASLHEERSARRLNGTACRRPRRERVSAAVVFQPLGRGQRFRPRGGTSSP